MTSFLKGGSKRATEIFQSRGLLETTFLKLEKHFSQNLPQKSAKFKKIFGNFRSILVFVAVNRPRPKQPRFFVFRLRTFSIHHSRICRAR